MAIAMIASWISERTSWHAMINRKPDRTGRREKHGAIF
jgi:hypothetical protein